MPAARIVAQFFCSHDPIAKNREEKTNTEILQCGRRCDDDNAATI
jgi:hypothetical protein